MITPETVTARLRDYLQHRITRVPRESRRSSIALIQRSGGSRLREIPEGTATTFRNPLEIVAPRLVRLGLQLRF